MTNKQHHRQCPMHMDFEHPCRGHKAGIYARPEFSPPYWVLVAASGFTTTTTRIDYCPYCGKDLGTPACICKDLEAIEERAAQKDAG